MLFSTVYSPRFLFLFPFVLCVSTWNFTSPLIYEFFFFFIYWFYLPPWIWLFRYDMRVYIGRVGNETVEFPTFLVWLWFADIPAFRTRNDLYVTIERLPFTQLFTQYGRIQLLPARSNSLVPWPVCPTLHSVCLPATVGKV